MLSSRQFLVLPVGVCLAFLVSLEGRDALALKKKSEMSPCEKEGVKKSKVEVTDAIFRQIAADCRKQEKEQKQAIKEESAEEIKAAKEKEKRRKERAEKKYDEEMAAIKEAEDSEEKRIKNSKMSDAQKKRELKNLKELMDGRREDAKIARNDSKDAATADRKEVSAQAKAEKAAGLDQLERSTMSNADKREEREKEREAAEKAAERQARAEERAEKKEARVEGKMDDYGDKMDRKIAEAVADGDKEKAKELRREKREKLRTYSCSLPVDKILPEDYGYCCKYLNTNEKMLDFAIMAGKIIANAGISVATGGASTAVQIAISTGAGLAMSEAEKLSKGRAVYNKMEQMNCTEELAEILTKAKSAEARKDIAKLEDRAEAQRERIEKKIEKYEESGNTKAAQKWRDKLDSGDTALLKQLRKEKFEYQCLGFLGKVTGENAGAKRKCCSILAEKRTWESILKGAGKALEIAAGVVASGATQAIMEEGAGAFTEEGLKALSKELVEAGGQAAISSGIQVVAAAVSNPGSHVAQREMELGCALDAWEKKLKDKGMTKKESQELAKDNQMYQWQIKTELQKDACEGKIGIIPEKMNAGCCKHLSKKIKFNEIATIIAGTVVGAAAGGTIAGVSEGKKNKEPTADEVDAALEKDPTYLAEAKKVNEFKEEAMKRVEGVEKLENLKTEISGLTGLARSNALAKHGIDTIEEIDAAIDLAVSDYVDPGKLRASNADTLTLALKRELSGTVFPKMSKDWDAKVAKLRASVKSSLMSAAQSVARGVAGEMGAVAGGVAAGAMVGGDAAYRMSQALKGPLEKQAYYLGCFDQK